jgi:hypothetical protein
MESCKKPAICMCAVHIKYPYNESLDLFITDGGLKRVDYGVGLGAGVEFGKVVASLNYQLGFANLIAPDPFGSETSEEKMRNRVFQISVAYMFGKK